MSKVWNIVGSFVGASNLIPENATFTKLEVLPNSLDTYYNGETFRMDLTFFQATFTSDEGEETKITIPSKDVKPKNFVPEVPFSNTLDHEITRHLEFEYTYIPADADKDDPSQHQTKDCSFEVTIWPEKFTVKKVEVIVPPNKTVYYDGEIFDEEGIIVQATSEEGDTKQINYCGDDTTNCNNASDCYWYSKTPLRSNDSETTEVIFNYCVPADAEHPNGYVAQFTYPVTVYQDERKAQLRVTYDKDTTKQVYYSGTTFNKTGIKVEAKYPRDDESVFDQNNVTTQCKIYVQEFPEGVLQYNDSNLGYLNVVVEYYDSTTKLTTTEVVPNIVFVYEVDQIQVHSYTKNEFYVGETFNSSMITLRVDYKPSSLPLDDYDGYIMTNDYSWTITSYINSAGKFLKAGEDVELELNYYDKNDPKGSVDKTRHFTSFYINILKQLKKLSIPRYTGETEYNNQYGIKILRYLGITSGTSLMDGYEDISVNGSWGYGTSTWIDNSFTATEEQNQYEIAVKIKAEDDTYTYQWEDGSEPSVTKSVSVTLKRAYSFSLGSSSLYLTGEDTSASTRLTLTAGLGLNADISLSGLTSYLSCSPTSADSSTTIYVNVDDVPSSDYSSSTTLKASLDSVPDYLTGPTQDTVRVYFDYEVPWSWSDPLSISWVNGLRKNNPSRYVGQYKSAEGENFYLLDVNGSTMTWGCYYDVGPFKTSSQSLSSWSSGGYSGSGGVQIQKAARTFQSMVARLFGTVDAQTRYYKYDNNTTWKSCTMRCWPPTMEELGLSTSSNRIYDAHSSNSREFEAGNVFGGDFWVGNGAWASADGSTIGGSGLGNVAAVYRHSKRSVDTATATTSNIHYTFCFKI